MEANPLVLVVSLIALVVAAVIAIGIKFGWWKEIAIDLWHWIDNAFHFIWNIIKDVWSWISDHWPLLLSILFGPFGIAVELIVSHWDQVVSFFKGLPGKLKNILSDALSWLVNVGHDIIDGLLNGVKEAWHKVEDFFTAAGKKIAGFLKNPLSIFSPSKVMQEQGAFIMEGLGLGLQTGFDRYVQSTLDATVKALHPATASSSSSTSTAGSSATSASTSSSSMQRGPAVVVQNAHFHDSTDLDLFLQKAAWAVRTQRI